VPTVTAPIPETIRFREARDAWADGQGGRLWDAWQAIPLGTAHDRDRRAARSKLLAWGRRREIESPETIETTGAGIQEYRLRKGAKRSASHRDPIEVVGIDAALIAITDSFIRAALVETDRQAASAAFEAWRGWPVYSGLSKSALALVWGRGTLGVEVRLVGGAEYTLAAPSTSKAWAAARKRWVLASERIGAALNSRQGI
jgi:hypothetical protein